jgi:hypothetical protein
MDVVDLLPAVERLEENIDDLEEALQKLLGSSLEETSRKLPLLDRAKLHVLVTYTLESLLHCHKRNQLGIVFLKSVLTQNTSLLATARRRCKRPPHQHRTNSPKTIFRKD